ncbi:MAG: aldose epimerase family protein [Halioglobus sp.]
MLLPRPPVDLQDVQVIDLSNARGDSLRLLTLGATIKEWNINTRGHGLINTVLGYPHEQSYLMDTAYHGAIAGRYCNRIANSRFTLGTEQYQLLSNEGPHHLHGGPQGFYNRLWHIEERDRQSLTLSLHSADGDQGYPGNLDVRLRYTLNDDGALDIEWQAQSDRDTVVSLTNHAYFNLAGCGDIRDQYLRIAASHYTPVTKDLIPTGEIRPVAGTVLDLRNFTLLDQLLNSDDSEITAHGGLDHNWAIDSGGVCAELLCPRTQLLLQASSTLPGLQCYTGNNLLAHGTHGCHEGVCLETQHYPNSPNEPGFPSPLLRAGETQRHHTRYHISEVNAEETLANV